MSVRVLALFVVLSSATAWAAEPARPSLSARVSAKVKSLTKKLGVAIAPVRVEKTADGEPKLVRWSFKDGKLVPKETTVALPGGGVLKRIISIEEGPDGKKRLRADTIFKRAGRAKHTKANLRSASLSDQKVSRGDVDTETGEVTPKAEDEAPHKEGERELQRSPIPGAATLKAEEKPVETAKAEAPKAEGKPSKEEKAERKERKLPDKLTFPGAYTRAVLASPVVHFAMTTSFFYLFWRYAPQLVGYELDATQAAMAAIGTKGITFPVVAYKAFKELKLKTKKKEEPAEESATTK